MRELDLRVEIAPDAKPDGDPEDWTWLDVSDYRRQGADVEIDYGRGDESSEVEAGSASVTFNLRDGLLSPRNPLSPLYRRIGTNTPIRLRVPIPADTFDGRTVASGLGTSSEGEIWANGGNWSVSGGSAHISLPANFASEAFIFGAGALDLDVTYSVRSSAVMVGNPWVSAFVFRREDSDNQYRVHTELKPAGVVTIKLTRVQAGSSVDVAEDTTTSATYGVGTKVWTRIVAEGGFMRAKVWSGLKSAEPAAWNIWSTVRVIQGGGYGFYQWRLAGTTNPGNVTMSIDDFEAYALLWSGNVPEWPPRWDKSGNDSTMTIQAAGPMRRLNQGEDPVKSPLSLQLPQYGPAGYWPLEDGSDATSAGSAISGGKAAVASGISFGNDDSPAGASSSAQLTSTGSTLKGNVTGDSTANWSAMLFVKLSALPAAETTIVEWTAKVGTLRRWVIRADALGWLLKIYDEDGTLVHNGGTVSYSGGPTEWTAVQLEVQQSGGNVNWVLIWNRLDLNTFFSIGGTQAGTSGRLGSFYIPGSTGMSDALISQIWIGPNSLPFVDATFFEVSRGYAGETASERLARLCAERGVALTTLVGSTEALGAQRPGKFLELSREAAVADLGILYERAYALGYIPRSARYNTPVRMEIDWQAGQLAEAPEPTDDDQRLRNRWVVKRVAGSEVVYENQDSIDRHGTITDSVEINIATDSRLEQHAGWRTSLTTYDELRWPTIELDLIAHPELRGAFLTCRVGSRITIVNPKDQVAGVEIDLVIEGVKQVIGRRRWDVTLTCSPAKPWDVAVWDSDAARWDSASTTLRLAVTAGATAWSITSVNPEDVWSTTATGYQWDVGGETVTVQSVGAATGTGPYVQAVTVLRAQNGVSKAQTAGTPIQLARPARWAL